jgi:Nif-specific ferredoxin III
MNTASITRDGRTWEPAYLESVNPETCIGCGRCFKVCGRGVLALMGVNEEGEIVDLDEDDIERKVMTVADAGNCIGCSACGRVCSKNSHSFTHN